MRRLASGLILCGALLVAYGCLWQLGVLPNSRVVVPQPLALERSSTRVPTEAAVPNSIATPPTQAPTPPESTSAPVSRAVQVVPPIVVAQSPVPPSGLVSADSTDRKDSVRLPPPGYAVRLVIPAIELDTRVEQAGIILDAQGNPTWQTLPFVAVHYGDLTALVGARGNAVIAGHVVTLREGNVFRSLYQVQLDSQIQVWDDAGGEHRFHVVEVQLVSPSDTWPMNQTPDVTLTLITCGGTFDPATRQFSERLIVTAKPATEGGG